MLRSGARAWRGALTRLCVGTPLVTTASSAQQLRHAAATPHTLHQLESTLRTLKSEIKQLSARCDKLEEDQRISEVIAFHSTQELTPMSLQEIVERCLSPSYKPHIFCHREYPLMLAHMLQQLQSMPDGLSVMPSILQLRQLFTKQFQTLVNSPVPNTPQLEGEFINLLKDIEMEQENVLNRVAIGLVELKKSAMVHRLAIDKNADLHKAIENKSSLHTRLDMFFSLRIQFKFLLTQMIELETKRASFVGIVCAETNIEFIVRDAMTKARGICVEHFGDSPEIILDVSNECHFPHLPENLSYMLIELLKNSLRATVDHHGEGRRGVAGTIECDEMPPVRVTISNKEENPHLCVCIADEGGGIRRSEWPKVFLYSFTTALKLKSSEEHPEEGATGHDDLQGTALAGFGFGLPISRLYARHFGGDLVLQSVEGYGTKAYLYINKDGYSSCSVAKDTMSV